MATIEELTSRESVEALLAGDSPVLLFKHSTRCGMSAAAARRIEAFLIAEPELPVVWARIPVVEERALSVWLAEHLSVRHQSPQLILLIDGRAVWDASHHGINADEIIAALGQHGII
jgi:bacillithiol system protein YtxJ